MTDGRGSWGPVLDAAPRSSGSKAGSSAGEKLGERQWQADPDPAQKLTGEELLQTLLVEVQGLRRDGVRTRDLLRATQRELAEVRSELVEFRDAAGLLKTENKLARERVNALGRYMVLHSLEVEEGEYVPSSSEDEESDGEDEGAGAEGSRKSDAAAEKEVEKAAEGTGATEAEGNSA